MDKFALEVLTVIANYGLHDMLFWRTDGEFAPITFFANCNDLFYWATADLEVINPDNFPEIERAMKDVGARPASTVDCTCCTCQFLRKRSESLDGLSLFCARSRKMRPQKCAYPEDKKLWPLFDACGPERTPEDEG